MKIITFFLVLNLSVGFSPGNNKSENVRYILIEAECKPGFDALPGVREKVIITKVWKEEFENAFEIVNAEPKLISDFEVALEKSYPGQINQIKDILVYMLNTEKEAKNLFKRKLGLFKTLEKGIIELKVK